MKYIIGLGWIESKCSAPPQVLSEVLIGLGRMSYCGFLMSKKCSSGLVIVWTNDYYTLLILFLILFINSRVLDVNYNKTVYERHI